MNSIFKIAAVAALCAAPAFAEDDDEVEEGPDMRPVVFIDSKAIVNKTDNASANFGGLIDRLNFALTECGIYRVLDSKNLSDGLVEDEMFKVVSDDGGKESKVETPGFKITMTIMQYGFASAGGADMYGNVSATRQAKIELILNVVDMRTKETKKSKNIAQTAEGTATAESNLDEQVLQAANKLVVDAIVLELVKLTPFSVLDVEDGEVLVDVPPSRVAAGQQLSVFKKGKAIKNKRTGKMTSKESHVATLGVVTLGEDSVTCKLLDGKIAPNEDAEEGSEYDKYIVRIPDAPAAPQATPPPAAPDGGSAVPF